MIHRLAIIAAMEDGARTIRDIANSTGIAYASVKARVSDLKQIGAVSTHGVLYVGNKGRPEKLYRLNQ